MRGAGADPGAGLWPARGALRRRRWGAPRPAAIREGSRGGDARAIVGARELLVVLAFCLVAAVGMAWRLADRPVRRSIAIIVNKHALRAGPLHLYEARP